MENEAASNAVGGVKDRDLPWSIVSTQFDSGEGPAAEKFSDQDVQPTFRFPSTWCDNEKILVAVNASPHAAEIPEKFRGSAIRVGDCR